MPKEKFFSKEFESSLEKEKLPQGIITVYLLRHGETTSDKTDPRRGLTEKGKEQAQKAALRIAQEIIQTTSPKKVIELRGYDSGVFRANQTLIEIAKILTEKSFRIYLPYSTQELAEDKFSLEEMKKKGLIYGEGPGIKPRIRNMILPDEAKKEIVKKAKEKGEEPVVTLLTTSPAKLKEMGIETPEEIFQRIEEGVKITEKLAHRLGKGESPRKIIVIATSHGGTLEGYLTQKFNLDPKTLGEIPNCEGIRLDFPGNLQEEVKISLWGDEMEKRAQEKSIPL